MTAGDPINDTVTIADHGLICGRRRWSPPTGRWTGSALGDSTRRASSPHCWTRNEAGPGGWSRWTARHAPVKYGPGISYDAWQDLVSLIEWLSDNRDRADADMWETRAGAQKPTTSRLMAWVALERMIRIARQCGLPGNLVAWARTRDDIYLRVMGHGWNHEIGSSRRPRPATPSTPDCCSCPW